LEITVNSIGKREYTDKEAQAKPKPAREEFRRFYIKLGNNLDA